MRILIHSFYSTFILPVQKLPIFDGLHDVVNIGCLCLLSCHIKYDHPMIWLYNMNHISFFTHREHYDVIFCIAQMLPIYSLSLSPFIISYPNYLSIIRRRRHQIIKSMLPRSLLVCKRNLFLFLWEGLPVQLLGFCYQCILIY